MSALIIISPLYIINIFRQKCDADLSSRLVDTRHHVRVSETFAIIDQSIRTGHRRGRARISPRSISGHNDHSRYDELRFPEVARAPSPMMMHISLSLPLPSSLSPAVLSFISLFSRPLGTQSRGSRNSHAAEFPVRLQGARFTRRKLPSYSGRTSAFLNGDAVKFHISRTRNRVLVSSLRLSDTPPVFLLTLHASHVSLPSPSDEIFSSEATIILDRAIARPH